jgi:hypothetical protein
LITFGLIIFLSPLRGIIDARLAHPHSNEGRLEQSQEAARRATQSPLIGYGAPLPSEDEDIGHNIGTHGQIWLVIFSHGFPALGLYLGFFGFMAWHFRRCRTQSELWAHTLVLMALLMMPVYGFLSLNFDITMARWASHSAMSSCPTGGGPRDRPEVEPVGHRHDRATVGLAEHHPARGLKRSARKAPRRWSGDGSLRPLPDYLGRRSSLRHHQLLQSG